MPLKRCVACGQAFAPRPQAPNQTYCPAPECQRERRRRWQRDKLATDPDYRDNQSRAQAAWVARHPDYWRAYRADHPDYTARNAAQQKARNARRAGVRVAKMDACAPPVTVNPVLFDLRFLPRPMIAKKDVWLVELRAHSMPCVDPACDCKEMTR